jgi:hypothetical protein
MNRLDHEPEVIEVAEDLGLRLDDFPVEKIIQHCLDQVASWLGPNLGSMSIEDVEAEVCRRLELRIVEIYSDDDLAALSEEYVAQREFVFAGLADDLGEKVFANVIRLNRRVATTGIRYVAVIDCRAPEKARRAFFSRWHEIAHLLSASKQTRARLRFPVRRSFPVTEPKERLMDHIAGRLAFHPGLFQPMLAQEVQRFGGQLTLGAIRAVQHRHSRHASLHATFKACIAHLDAPAIFLEIGMGYKDAEARLLASGQPLRRPPVPQLRALVVIPNRAVQGRFRVDRNIQIPPTSVLAKLFAGSYGSMEPFQCEAVEDLSSWRHSSGMALPRVIVHIHAKRHGGHILAVLQLS